MDLPYLAGFFDGEGCVGIYGGARSHYLSVQLVQNESPASVVLLDECCAAFGGTVSVSLSSNGRRKLNWQLTGEKAAVLLEGLRPHLRLKAEQVDVALAWQRGRLAPSRGPGGRIARHSDEEMARSRDAALQMRRLKKV